jgi:SPX domain protein involved in polyphosphate accumulation
LNYLGFHKILKKHDKNLPHSPCRQFYIAHLHNQPWVQGNYADLLVALSDVYAKLRGDRPGSQVFDEDADDLSESTTIYWVNMNDVSALKHQVLQHLPVFQENKDVVGDAQIINTIFLDNSSLELYHAQLDKRPNATSICLKWTGNQTPEEVIIERILHKKTWNVEQDIREHLILPEVHIVDFLEGLYTVEQAMQYYQSKHVGLI